MDFLPSPHCTTPTWQSPWRSYAVGGAGHKANGSASDIYLGQRILNITEYWEYEFFGWWFWCFHTCRESNILCCLPNYEVLWILESLIMLWRWFVVLVGSYTKMCRSPKSIFFRQCKQKKIRLKRSQQQKDPSAIHSLTTLQTSLDIFWSVTQETSNTNFPSLVALIISFQYRSCSHRIQPFLQMSHQNPQKTPI